MMKVSLFFGKSLLSAGLKFPPKIFTLTLFIIIFQTNNCNNSLELPRAVPKKFIHIQKNVIAS